MITGTATIDTNTKVVTIVSLDDGATLVGSVIAGNEFQWIGENNHFHIEITPTSNSALTILETYAGVTKSTAANFQIFTGYHGHNLIRVEPSMSDSFYSLQRNFERISDEFTSLGSTADEYQVVNKKYIGIPVQGAYFGYHKWTGAVQIDRLIIASQNGEVTDNDLVYDIEINGVLQGLNLTVALGQSSKDSGTLTSIAQAGQVTRFKWITVVEPCASNWDVDIHYHNSSGLKIYYDFQKTHIGNLVINAVIGAAYKPPNRGKVFGMEYELDDDPEGSTVILELLKNGASIGSGVLFTIPDGSKTGYLECSQTEFLTTQTCSLKINQVGSVVPGNNLRTTLHSYHTIAT